MARVRLLNHTRSLEQEQVQWRSIKLKSKNSPRGQSHDTKAESVVVRSEVIQCVASTAHHSFPPSITVVLRLGHIKRVCMLSSLLSRSRCLQAANCALQLLYSFSWQTFLHLHLNGSGDEGGKVAGGMLSGFEPWPGPEQLECYCQLVRFHLAEQQ